VRSCRCMCSASAAAGGSTCGAQRRFDMRMLHVVKPPAAAEALTEVHLSSRVRVGSGKDTRGYRADCALSSLDMKKSESERRISEVPNRQRLMRESCFRRLMRWSCFSHTYGTIPRNSLRSHLLGRSGHFKGGCRVPESHV